MLSEGRVVVLTGMPGVGKSMLAEMLLLNHWHEGWSVISISSDIEEAWSAFRRSERQIFFYDDFLGQTDFSEHHAKNEDSRIVRFIERVTADPNKRFVMTSRSQILRQAEAVSEPIARGRLKTREMVLELTEYGPLERAKILYNHLYFSGLPRSVIRGYVESRRYFEVVEHSNFSPRIVEQVLRRSFSSSDELALVMKATHDRPIDLWGTMFSTVLSRVAKRIVLTLVTLPVRGVSLDRLEQLTIGDADPTEYRNSLRALDGTFIKIVRKSLTTADTVSFADPSVRDFVLATLDVEARLVLNLVLGAAELDQVALVLNYAASKSDGAYRFPGLARFIREHQSVVAHRINGILSAVERDSASARNPQSYVVTYGLNPLASMLTQVFQMLPSAARHFLEIGLVLALENPGWNADTYETLAWAIVNYMNGDLGLVRKMMADLVDRWGACLLGEIEIARFVEFVEECQKLPSLNLDLSSIIVRGRVEDALRNELDNMSGNRQRDEDFDMAWLASLEHLAGRVGIANVLAEEIESERRSIVEYHAERASAVRPTSGAGVGGFTREVGTVDRSHITALFDQLS
jgi:hypothetical protein